MEEDDDFEEFEMGADYDEYLASSQIDAEMRAGGDADKKIWQQDWEDEEQDEDFHGKLKAQLGL